MLIGILIMTKNVPLDVLAICSKASVNVFMNRDLQEQNISYEEVCTNMNRYMSNCLIYWCFVSQA